MKSKDLKTTASENKEIIRNAFTEINKGNFEPFMSILDENFKLIIPGNLPNSGTFVGIQELT